MSGIVWDDEIDEGALETPAVDDIAWDKEVDTSAVEEAENVIDTSTISSEGSVDTDTGVYSPPINEEGGTTISPDEQQFRQDESMLAEMGSKIEEITGATTSVIDNVKGNTPAFNKKEKAITDMLEKDYGVKIQNANGTKYLVTPDGRSVAFPDGGSIADVVNSMRGEIGGAMAGAQAGALAGSAVGPVGTVIGGIVGGGAGAYYGSGLDIDRNAMKAGIEVTPEERSAIQTTAGVTDMVAGGVLAGLGKLLSKSALKSFTSIAEMPKKEREAVLHLAQKSGLSESQMETHIKDYAKSTDVGEISTTSAVEAGAKASEKEQLGFLTEAMKQSDSGKKNVLEETTKRTEIVGDALRQMDDELETGGMLENALKRHTMDDEGRRKATDWNGLSKSLRTAGLDESDPIYQRVLENAETFGSKETDVFQTSVRPLKPDEKAIGALQPFTETTRASVGSQLI